MGRIQIKRSTRASIAASSQVFASVTVLSCPVKCCSDWEANQIKFLIQTAFAIPQSLKECGCFGVSHHNFVCARLSRSCLHPLVFSFAELGVLSAVRRPTTNTARIQMRSVSQATTEVPVCKSGPISLCSLDRLNLREKTGSCAATHLRSRLKPAFQASATAAAFKAPDICRPQVRLPLRTLRVRREGKPQFWDSKMTSIRSSGVRG